MGTIDYLGHSIRFFRLELAEHTTAAVGKLEYPTTQTKICSFLGLCNVCRRFIQNVTRLAASPNEKLIMDRARYFRPLRKKESAAAASLKEALISRPVLVLPQVKGSYTLDTDVCDK